MSDENIYKIEYYEHNLDKLKIIRDHLKQKAFNLDDMNDVRGLMKILNPGLPYRIEAAENLKEYINSFGGQERFLQTPINWISRSLAIMMLQYLVNRQQKRVIYPIINMTNTDAARLLCGLYKIPNFTERNILTQSVAYWTRGSEAHLRAAFLMIVEWNALATIDKKTIRNACQMVRLFLKMYMKEIEKRAEEQRRMNELQAQNQQEQVQSSQQEEA